MPARPRSTLAALLVVALTAGAGPARAAEVTVEEHRVTVSQPDADGRPVGLEVDVYVPRDRPRGGRRRALVAVFHGGGSSKDNAYDAGHARALAARGRVAVMWSQRGHGGSDGRTAVAGPLELRDAHDVLRWVLRRRELRIDRRRIAFWGDSQGGLHVNLLAAHAGDREVNPTGLRPAALLPGNTPDRVLDALAPHGVVKLSFGAGLLQTYGQGASGRISPLLAKWIGTLGADDPAALGGDADRCASDPHDGPLTPTRHDLAYRSVGCDFSRVRAPTFWAQALDDELFPPEMAVHGWRRIPGRARHRLYLSVGGHGTPAAPDRVERDELRARLRFLDAVLAGRRGPGPAVTYWRRDPRVGVAADARRWPDRAWRRATARRWPPPGTRRAPFVLAPGGRLVPAGAGGGAGGSAPLLPVALDTRDDPVAQTVFAAVPAGTSSPAAGLRPPRAPGVLATFATAPLPARRELAGEARLELGVVPRTADEQVAGKLFAVLPDGRRTFLARAVAGLRGREPGTEVPATLRFQTVAAALPAGTRLELWLTAGDPSFWKPYPGMAGVDMRTGPGARLTVRWR